ncbi:MAG: DUF3343 domain-containing protein [Oscillospiraceae bacterium]|nr:DUF3343 domain-containing protein [Oscillospiraceae bacterium]
MPDSTLRYYILFENYEQGLALHGLLDEQGLPNRIAPAPRCFKEAAACGMSLLVEEADIDAVRQCIKENRGEYRAILPLAGQLQARRDKYC